MSFSFAVGNESRKVCIGVLLAPATLMRTLLVEVGEPGVQILL
jgi:hypothetical protein